WIAVDPGHRWFAVGAGRAARGETASTAAQCVPTDSETQQGATKQHSIRQVARSGGWRRGQRRDTFGVAAIRAVDSRGGSQRRELQRAANRNARRVGAADGTRRQ